MSEFPWRLEDLVRRSAAALERVGVAGDSGRVRWMPDERTVRYYTTLGLLDRPGEFRGRTAYYGVRHLVQLVAIKRLQARGESLEAVQRALPGLPDARLASLAGLDARLLRDVAADPDEHQRKRLGGAGPLRSGAEEGQPVGGLVPERGERRFWEAGAARAGEPPAIGAAIAMGGGATLVLPASAACVDGATAAEVIESSRELMECLERLGLLSAVREPNRKE